MKKQAYAIENIQLAQQGLSRLDWVRERMPILQQLKTDFASAKPFTGIRIGICLHVEAKTGIWLETLIAGGAEIALTGSPGTTQDEVAAALVKEYDVRVFSWRGESFQEHLQNVQKVLMTEPNLIADNGAIVYVKRYRNIISRRSSSTTHRQNVSLKIVMVWDNLWLTP